MPDNNSNNLDDLAHSAIVSTERYYREQIFSSGCSSMVPIYRISQNAKVEAVVQQLSGSPYVQKEVEFSTRVIEALIDVNLYCFEGKHFFFQGDIPKDVQGFLDSSCKKVDSFSQVVQTQEKAARPEWCDFDTDVSLLAQKFPVLNQLNMAALTKQLFESIRHITVPPNIQTHLEMYHKPEWQERLELNQSAMYFMLEIANKLSLTSGEVTHMVMLGIVKDLGYTRLSEQVENFEILHPLVSHELASEANNFASDKDKLSDEVINSILVQHEFVDSTGPLARMKHPLVTRQLEKGMPKVAQISGLCDLYFGFLKDYSSTLAFAITCGFVLGQGKVPPRYDASVIRSFSSIFGDDSKNIDVPADEASKMVSSVLATLKDRNVRANAEKIINLKTETGYEKITLALNIVRNIARHQPDQLSEQSLVNVLNLPEEFGLNY